MELAARIGTMARRGAPLPYLRRVAYLESHTDEYINTGYVFQYGDRVKCKFSATELGHQTTQYFWGSETAYNEGINCYFDPKTNYRMRATYGVVGITLEVFPFLDFEIGMDYECDYSSEVLKINSSKLSPGRNSGLNNKPVLLFADYRNNGIRSLSTGWIAKQKTFSFSAERNGSVLIDLNPVLDLSGRPCFYNEAPISSPPDDPSRFFYNASGTGEFTWGELET